MVSDNNIKDSLAEEKSEGLVISRRAFLTVSACAGAALTASCAVNRVEGGLVSSAEGSDEGVITEEWIATSCLNCPTRCATKVRVVNGKAIRIAGNPLSRVSEGENCPRSHIGLQVLYDPDRVKSQPHPFRLVKYDFDDFVTDVRLSVLVHGRHGQRVRPRSQIGR